MNTATPLLNWFIIILAIGVLIFYAWAYISHLPKKREKPLVVKHIPKEGNCSIILSFINHIFGDQYELGLDYIQLLYQQPRQKLPVLYLSSNENPTGKSTFIKLMQAIFTGDCIIIGEDEFSNLYNDSWAKKLLICFDEGFIRKRALLEKIKSHTNAEKILIHKKGNEYRPLEFIGKFILTSNIYVNESDQIIWLIQIPTIYKPSYSLLEQLTKEIPAFLYFLNNRKLSTKQSSRLWFDYNLLTLKNQ